MNMKSNIIIYTEQQKGRKSKYRKESKEWASEWVSENLGRPIIIENDTPNVSHLFGEHFIESSCIKCSRC